MNTPRRPFPTFPLRLSHLLVLALLGGCATQDFVKKEVEPYGDRLRSMESWFSAINNGMDTQAKRILEVETRLAGLEKNSAALAARQEGMGVELAGAGRRLDVLAADLTALRGQVDGAGTSLAAVGRRLDGLEAQVAASGRRAEGTVAGLALLEGRVGVLEGNRPGVSSADSAATSTLVPGVSVPIATPMPAANPPAAPRQDESQTFATQRLANLEAGIADSARRGQDQVTQLAAANQRLAEMQTALDQVKVRAEANSQAIARVEGRVGELGGHLDAARGRAEAGAKELAESGLRLTMVQELLKGQSERLSRGEIEAGKISATAQEALDRARLAGKLAEGKLVFETTLADEIANFGFEEALLSAAAKKQLDEFAERLKAENRGVFIEIQGHTDNRGSDEANLRLSRDRAQAVRDYLNQAAGIPLHRLAVAAYGESKPVADNKTREGRARNRRVVLVVLR